MPNLIRQLSFYPYRIFLALLIGFGSCASFAQTSGIRLTDEQALAYIASYPDLITSMGTDIEKARIHYENSAANEGRSISFNTLQYIASYPDLITVFGLDTETALRQYIRQGKNQGRTPTFDGLEYIASNMSLISYLGTDANAAARHYITTGYKAGLKTASFDPLKYIASYADLIFSFGKNVVSGITHYITRGFSEGRTTTFNTTQYLANYSDLRTAFGTNTTAATSHYITSGFTEGRNDKKPNNAPTVTANAGTTSTSIPGEITAYVINSTIALTAIAGDVDGDRLTYSWTIQSKPVDSTATLGSPTNASSGIAPDKPGSYTLQVTVSDGKATASASLTVIAGTPVSGTLSGSNIWSKSSSPYVQVDRLAIPTGASLTIPAGVQLYGNGNTIQVQGGFFAIGTQAEKVQLNRVYIQPLGNYPMYPATGGGHELKIVYTDLKGSLYSIGSSSYGSFLIEDSRLDLNGQIYLPSQANDSSIERNYFVSGGISSSYSGQSKNLLIKNNSFPSGPPNNYTYYPGGYVATFYTSSYGSGAKTEFSFNTFRTPTGTSNSTTVVIASQGNGNLDARNNYWGTTDVSSIDRMISDKNDDLNNSSVVNYMPFLTGPDLLTPIQ